MVWYGRSRSLGDLHEELRDPGVRVKASALKALSDSTIRDAVRTYLKDIEGYNKIVKEYGDIADWDTRQVTNMYGMFQDATSFNGDLSKWDTRQVTDMERMFADATSFNGDLSKWDTRSLTAERKEEWVGANRKHGAKLKGPNEL